MERKEADRGRKAAPFEVGANAYADEAAARTMIEESFMVAR